MRNALVIAAREFEEKRFVVVAALAFAVLPFILAIIPGVRSGSRHDVIAVAAALAAALFALGLAVMTGASFVGRDLSDGRMSFYFSRPTSAISIWFGKLTAALLMIAGCFGLIIGPAWLVTGQEVGRVFMITVREEFAYVLLAALALFLVAHVIGTLTRSRSPLITFDFAAAVLCGVAIRYLILPLAAGQAQLLIKWLTIFLATALVIAIVAGGAWQLERGRTDRRRNHLALSQFLWTAMAVALLIAAAYVGWVTSVKLTDLHGDVAAERSANGPYAVIAGKASSRGDYHAAFLLNADDGSAARIDPRARYGVRYTRDGRAAVVPHLAGNVVELWIYRNGSKEPLDTGLTVSGDYFLSDDGGRIATLSNPPTLSIYDVAGKRSLASVRLPESRIIRGFFISPDVVRLYLNTPNDGLKIVEVDIRSRGLRETGTIAWPRYVAVYPNSDATRMLVWKSREDAVTLNDARSGAMIKTLSASADLKTARFLRDGRIVLVDGPVSATVLHILTPDGVLQKDVPLGESIWTRFIGDDGKRLVLSPTDKARNTSLITVDIDRGIIERREAIRSSVPTASDLLPPIQPLHEVFYGNGKAIVAWNPATGAKRMITGK